MYRVSRAPGSLANSSANSLKNLSTILRYYSLSLLYYFVNVIPLKSSVGAFTSPIS